MVPATGKTASGLPTDFELMVLLATLTVGEGIHGAAIAREIRRMGGCRVVLKEVHAALDRLERNELVVSSASDPTLPQRRRGKRIFAVTHA